MKLLTFSAAFLILILSNANLCFAGRCIVISGIEEDQAGTFWEYKDKLKGKGKDKLMDCDVFRSFSDLMKASPKPSHQTIEIHVLSHGAKDGSTLCAKTEAPSDIIQMLNRLSFTNKIFTAFNSCYSDQIIKERVLFDQRTPKAQNNLIDNTCLYSASSANNAAVISNSNGRDENTFAKLKFLDKNTNGKTINELFLTTTTGLLSGAPFDASGVSDFWKNGVSEQDSRKMNALIKKLDPKTLNEKKCFSVSLCTKVSAADYYQIAKSLSMIERMLPLASWKPENQNSYVESYQRLCENSKAFNNTTVGAFFKNNIADWNNAPSFSDFKAACKTAATSEIFCTLHDVSSADYEILYSLSQLRTLMYKMGIPSTKYKNFPDQLNRNEISKTILEATKNKSGSEFNSCSMSAMMGEASDPEIFSGLDGADSMDWGSLLGTFSRMSVETQMAGTKLSSSTLDQARFNACAGFSYDSKGMIQFQKKN